MEFLNKIELKGYVGHVDTTKVGDTKYIRFSVCTEYAFNSINGDAVIENTWHNCAAWANSVPDAENIKKGDAVYVSGRLRAFRYTTPDGGESRGYEVMVRRLSVIATDTSLA